LRHPRISTIAATLCFGAGGVSVWAETTEPWQVMDVSVNPPRPIPDARVLATYERSTAGLGHPTVGCARAWSGTSDSKGEVRIPAVPESYFSTYSLSAQAYKPGYRRVRYGERVTRTGRHHISLVPVPSSETIEARINDIEAYGSQSRCGDPDTRLQLVEFMRAIQPEVAELKRTAGNAEPLLKFEYYLWRQESAAGIAQGPEPKRPGELIPQSTPRSTIDARKVEVSPYVPGR
jgi:hypothetical protein